jgi:hydroxymethylpyrimidine/phosphomethylpyrimidine kinase
MIIDLMTAIATPHPRDSESAGKTRPLFSGEPPKVLSIAGVDPSGGAGLLADIKTFTALGAYGCGVVAGLTAQSTQGVTAVQLPSAEFVGAQLDTLLADIEISAVKTGMLGQTANVQVVAEKLTKHRLDHLVLDPVMIAKSGDALLNKEATSLLRDALIPLARVLTPNLPEAGALLYERGPETTKEMTRTCERLHRLLRQENNRWILLKGGHLPGGELIDLLYDGDRMIELRAERFDTRHTHGTGCALSAAITALMPQSENIPTAVAHAHGWLQQAIRSADALQISRTPQKGHGPVHHTHALCIAQLTQQQTNSQRISKDSS